LLLICILTEKDYKLRRIYTEGGDMTGSPIDIIIFAPLAPVLGVLLFWFIQLLFIESNKYLLGKIQKKHEPLLRFTNFIGILFQTLCHALGYTVTKSGIAHFQVTVHYGKVKPKKEKKGVFEWIANGFLFFGPFFIPPALLFLAGFLLIGQFTPAAPVDYTFAEGLITFGQNLYLFSQQFFGFLATIDFLDPRHIGFALLLIFLGLGMRPSYIGEKPRKKVDMIYDLKNIRDHLLERPLYLVLFFLIIYVFFYSSVLLKHNAYIIAFSLFGWLSILALISLLLSHIIIVLIYVTDKIPKLWRCVSFFMLPFSYVGFRVLFVVFPIESFDKPLSLLLMVVITSVVIILLLRYKTNTFKTSTKMRQKRVVDGPKRIVKK
jgi:hypothetical protein